MNQSRTKLKEGMVIVFKEPSYNIAPGIEYVVTDVEEEFPRWNEYHRMTSYENTIFIKQLNTDGTYNGEAKTVNFTTCRVKHGAINENDIEIIRELKRSYV